MGAIATVEEVMTLSELGSLAQKGDVPLTKIAYAFGALLRYAGSKQTDEEVYSFLFIGSANQQPIALNAVTSLMLLMVPKSVRNGTAVLPGLPGSAAARPTEATAANTSKRRTKQRSQKASGSPVTSSGV
jgi:hypothetical protein